MWEAVLDAQPEALSARTRKALQSLRTLVDGFPRTQDQAAAIDFIELAQQIRAKYRQACAGLPGAAPDLAPTSSDAQPPQQGLSF